MIRASPIETHGHRPAFAYRVGTADQQGANMFQRLQALLIGAIIAITLTGPVGRRLRPYLNIPLTAME